MLELACESDFEDVNRLARQVVAYHAQWNPNEQVVTYPYPKAFYMECIRTEAIYDNAIYVMRQDSKVVGYMRIYLWETNSTTSAKRLMLNIDDIGVDEDLRGQGIGTQMMEQLHKLALQWSVSSIGLYVDAPNEIAQAYYKKCGFRVRNLGMTLDL